MLLGGEFKVPIGPLQEVSGALLVDVCNSHQVFTESFLLDPTWRLLPRAATCARATRGFCFVEIPIHGYVAIVTESL